jgi:hypothetical protein
MNTRARKNEEAGHLGPQDPNPASRFGKMTGIRQIDPTIFLERSVPDILAPGLGIRYFHDRFGLTAKG